MKLGRITINNVQYPACLSTRVIIAIKNKTEKNFEEGINEILNGSNFENLFWLMSQMLDAGKRYSKLIGVESPEPPEEDGLLDLLGVDDYGKLLDTVTAAVIDTAEPEVAVESDEKNAKTTKKKA